MNTQELDNQRILNKEQVEHLVNRLLQEFRSLNWEDDISRNALDTAPFENLPPISGFIEELERMKQEPIPVDQILAYAANDTAPIPSAADREGYSANYSGRYWLTGLLDFLKVKQVAQQHSIELNKLFDFGCASGRVLRHFAFQSEIPELWGSDINARHIRWLCEHMPSRIKPVANHCLPQLPFPDHKFDAITAFSVFTHIDTFETCWLAELKRILRPGGFAYLTVHNNDTWSKLRQEIDNPNNRLIESMKTVDPDVKEKLLGPMPPGRTVYRFTHKGPYRAQVFHCNQYLQNVWGRYFDHIEILPCQHIRQSVVILK